MHFQSSDLFFSLSASFCATLEGLFAPIADCFISFIEAVGVVNFIALLVVTTVCIVAAALKMHAPIATVRVVREPKRWIQAVEAGIFIREVTRWSVPDLLWEVKAIDSDTRFDLQYEAEEIQFSKRYVSAQNIVVLDKCDWSYATPALLSKNPLTARRARKAFISGGDKDLWRLWQNMDGVTATDRRKVYELAIERAQQA